MQDREGGRAGFGGGAVHGLCGVVLGSGERVCEGESAAVYPAHRATEVMCSPSCVPFLCHPRAASGSHSPVCSAAAVSFLPSCLQEFSWLNPPGGRGGDVLAMINPYGPVRDQGECATCVSFAVVAAAEVGFFWGGRGDHTCFFNVWRHTCRAAA